MKRRWRGVVVKNKKKNRVVGNSKFSSSSYVVVELSDSSISIADVNSNIDKELRSMFTEIFTESARLRKQLNSVIRRSLKLEVIKLEDDP
ncbi:hypothetical protein QQ045_021027 [Rhodiola kirilowii]